MAGSTKPITDAPITDARRLGYPKMALLGLQHMFAMFGATVLVPLISGLSVQVTLIGVGVGTLIFHYFAKGRVPVFLGSSFAFLVGIQLITNPNYGIYAGTDMTHQEKLSYATGGIFVAGLIYLVLALIIKLVGVRKVMRYLPPVVTAPIVLIIGIMLAPFAINMSASNILLAVVALGIVIIASIWGKGMVKIVPIVLGIVGAYVFALILHFAGVTNPDGSAIFDFTQAAQANIVGAPPFVLARFDIVAILVMAPFALATIAEHIADMVALTSITGKNFVENPGLHRTLIGDGLATTFSGLIGGPASTTYGENVGVVVLTKVHDAKVVILAAIYATVLGFLPIFAALIYTIPDAIVGGVSFILYGMIAAVGIRTLVEHRVDISKTRNLIILAVVMVSGLGLRFANPITFTIAGTNIPIDRLGIAIAAILGILLNAILPGKDYEFGENTEGDSAINLGGIRAKEEK